MIDQIISLLYNALFFITPLIMTKSTSELFEFNKILFIYGSTVLITFFWFLKMVVHKKIILKKTFLDIPILIFFLTQLISTVISIDRHTSIFGYYGRFNGGLLSIICYITLYYAFTSNIINVEKILRTIAASSLFVILWAIPGHFGHDLTCLLFTGKFNNSCWDNVTLAFKPELRAFSTLGQPNWLGAFLAVAFFIGLYFLLKNQIKNKETMKQSIIMTIYLFLNFSMILMSRSRSAIGAIIVGLILFVGYYLFFIKTNFKKILLILFLVTITPIIFFKTGEDKIDKFLTLKTYNNIFTIKKAVPLVPNGLVPSSSSSVTESFDIRKIVWEGAWKLAKQYPLFGTGVETFAYSYNFVRPAAHNLTSEWDYVYNKAHNEYLNFLATTGFVGLGSYLLLIGSFILFVLAVIPIPAGAFPRLRSGAGMTKQNNLTIEQLDNRTILIVCLLIAYITILITNFFGFSTTTIQLFFYLIPAFLISSAISPQSTHYNLQPNNLSFFQKFLVFLILSSTIYFLASIVVFYLADVNYSYGLKYLKPKTLNYQKAATYFEQAIKLKKEQVYEDKFSGALAYLSALAAFQKQDDLAKQIAVLSDFYNQKLVQTYPNNVFYWKTRAKNMYFFYQITGNANELLQGINALKTARNLYPTDPKIPYYIALYYTTLYDSTTNNFDKQNWQKSSLKEIDKSIKLKSNYREAYLFKGQLLKKYGKIGEAKKVFKYILNNFNKNDAVVLKELNE